MDPRLKELITKRSNRAKQAGEKQVLKNIQGSITENLTEVTLAGSSKGPDKVNQLILQKTQKLQSVAVEQLNEIATNFGISGVDSGELSITLPTSQTSTADLQLPKIPVEIQAPVKNLTLTPVKVKVSDIGTVSNIIQDQFTNQLLPLNYDNLEEEAKREALNLIEPTVIRLVETLLRSKPPYCPADNRLARVLEKYNRMLEFVEQTSFYLNTTTAGLNILTRVLDGGINAKAGIQLAKTAINQAMKILPYTPGALPSIITDLEDVSDLITFKPDGTAILKEKRTALETGTYYISLAARIVSTIVIILRQIAPLLKNCGLEPNTIGPETIKFITQAETKANSNTNESYQGFTFQITEVNLPNDPTVTRRIAQALNTEGVIALQTEPSFTQNPKVLIEELKLIIDRDNLKAY